MSAATKPQDNEGFWRPVGPDEVFAPGRQFRMNQTTGQSEVPTSSFALLKKQYKMRGAEARKHVRQRLEAGQAKGLACRVFKLRQEV